MKAKFILSAGMFLTNAAIPGAYVFQIFFKTLEISHNNSNKATQISNFEAKAE